MSLFVIFNKIVKNDNTKFKSNNKYINSCFKF